MEKIYKFLDAQMRHNLELDEAEGYIDKERDGEFKRGTRQKIYQNTMEWIKQNQSGILFNEFQRLEKAELNEETLSTDIATFTTHLFPAVRRIYNRLIAMDLVSTQPLSGPSGIIYYMDHKFGTSGGGATSGQRLDQYRHDSYANSSEGGTIRDIDFGLTSTTVTAVTKKIQAKWSIEAEQDLKSQWNVNLEAELMDKLTLEVVREIDGQLIADLEGGVAHNVNWNKNGYRADDKSTWERKQYDETIKEKILEAGNEIYKAKYANPNWALMHPDVYLRLQKLEEFNVDPTIMNNQGTFQRRYVGTLSVGSLMKVYVDPDFTNDKILMGLKGDSWDVAVAYYAPYIPLFTSPKYIQGDDFTQFLRGAMTRYAHGVIPNSTTDSTNDGLATVTLTSS
jgi:hypothetical protein